VVGLRVDVNNILGEEDKIVLSKIRDRGEAWIVGGWVRELLSKEEVTGDLDIATTLMPKELKEIFPRSIMVGEKYGTVIVRLEGVHEEEGLWEVTTLRREGGYGDGRRPDNVSFGNDINADLERRDFTINAMAIDHTGELIDLGGKGHKDLSKGLLRTVGDPKKRIAEDGLRIMRAFRFLDNDPNGLRIMDDGLSEAISTNCNMLESVSKERIWAELSQILSGNNSRGILESMRAHGVLGSILPAIDCNCDVVFSRNVRVNLSLLCSSVESSGSELADSLKEFLRISNDDAGSISFLHDSRNADLDHSPSSIRRFRAYLPVYLQSEVLDYMAGLGNDTSKMMTALESVPPNKAGNAPLVNGNMISETTGMEAGRRLGKLKGWLHRRQIEDDLGDSIQVLELLSEIDWSGSDPGTWATLSWP
jgi:tRNA nucleotidyltransferase/poly(A) polymerase|tara:strand:+ start:1582 stop:2844 length:1263 start_codon:yes stop_codon:yes gene_type:complete